MIDPARESDSIQRAIARLGDLPAMPEAVAQALRLTEDPNAGMQDVRAVIEQDPALTAKILRISNSPYYGMRRTVGTLQLALVILGIREVRNIVLGVSVFDTLNDGRISAQTIAELKAHSVMVAGMSRKLTFALRLSFQGEDFIAGLLHDIGKILMLTAFQSRYFTFLAETKNDSAALCEKEIALFGFTHADAAAALATKWNLPETLHDAVLYHHALEQRPLTTAKDPMLAAVVRLANAGVRSLDSFEAGSPSLRAIEEAFEVLRAAPDAMGDAALREALIAFSDELTQMPPLDM